MTWSRGASSSVNRSPGGVEQRRALAAHRLGDQRAVVLGARQRQRGGVELAELEVGELGAGRVGEHRAGADRAPRVGRALPERRAAAGGQHRRAAPRSRRASVTTPGAALAVAPQRERRGRPRAPRSGRSAATSSASRPVIARPVCAAAGVDDAARRVPALEAERRGSPSGSRVEAHAAALAARATAAGASRGQHLDRRRPAERRGRRRACRRRGAAGESSGGERRREPALGPEAGALGERLARDERHRARRASAAAQRDVQAGGAAADDDDVAVAAGSAVARPAQGAVRYPRRWASTSPSLLVRARHRRPPGERRPAAGDRGGARARRAGRASSGSRRRRRPASSSLRVHTAEPTSTRSRSSARAAAA